MNSSNRNSETKTPTEEATSSSMNPPPFPVSLSTMTNTTTGFTVTAAAGGGRGGGQGERLHVGSGGNPPNTNRTSSFTENDDGNHNGDNNENTTDKNKHTPSTPTATMSNLDVSTSSSSSSSSSSSPSFPSSSAPVPSSMATAGVVAENNETLPEVIAAAAAMTTAAPPPPPPSPPSSSRALQTTQRASSTIEYDTPDEAAASTPDSEHECEICCYPFPLEPKDSAYKTCCGKSFCGGCILAQQRTLIIGTNVAYPIVGSEEEKREFREIGRSEWTSLCPFCNAEAPVDDEEELTHLLRRIDEYNDPEAMNILGAFYMEGKNGLPKNLIKAEELWKRSYDLGGSIAAYTLACLHSTILFDDGPAPFPDEVLMMKYSEEEVRRGHYSCRELLADHANQSGNQEEEIRQYMMAACSGHETAMENVMRYHRQGFLSKDDFATTLRAHKAANDKRRSKPRDYWQRYDYLMDTFHP